MTKDNKNELDSRDKETINIMDSFENQLNNMERASVNQNVRFYTKFNFNGQIIDELENIFLVKKENENGEIIYEIYTPNAQKILETDSKGKATVPAMGEIDVNDLIEENEKNLKGSSEKADIKEVEKDLSEKKEEKTNNELEELEKEDVEGNLSKLVQDLELTNVRKITDKNLHARMPDVFENSEESVSAYSKTLHGFVILTKKNDMWELNDNVKTSNITYKTVISVNEDGSKIEKKVPHAIMKTNKEEKEIAITIGQYGQTDIETVDVMPCQERVARSVRQDGEIRDESVELREKFDQKGIDSTGANKTAHSIAHSVEEAKKESNEIDTLNSDYEIDENATIPDTDITWKQLANYCNEDVEKIYAEFNTKMVENGNDSKKTVLEMIQEHNREDEGRTPGDMSNDYSQGRVPKYF